MTRYLNSSFDGAPLRVFRFHATVALIVLLVSINAGAQTTDVPTQYTFGVGTSSDYLFRGREFYDGPSLQPTVGVKHSLDQASALSADLWAHLPLGGEQRESELFEFDPTLSYQRTVGPADLSLGHTGYLYAQGPTTTKNTAEFFLASTFDTYLTPRAALFYDYLSFDSYFIELSMSQRFDFPVGGRALNLTPFSVFGWSLSAPQSIYERDGLTSITYGVLSEIESGTLRILPSLSYSQRIDPRAVNTFFGGVSIQWGLKPEPSL